MSPSPSRRRLASICRSARAAAMASSSSSLHAASAAPPQGSAAAAASSSSHCRPTSVAFRLPLKLKKPLLIRPKGLGFFRDRSVIAKAQLNEVVGGHANDAAPSGTNPEVPASEENDGKAGNQFSPSAPLSEEAIAEFMSQVSSLVKLVDSKDIVELKLKQNDCELIIRKKEALPQAPPAPVVMMQAPAPIPSAVPQPPPAPALPATSSSASDPLAPAPAPKATKSSHRPLKSPMAGTFYRSPGPGIAPFVKPGDKVNKGQVLCIIEAMKLMNEIEADQAGTVVDILVEDGKPVGIDQPIFVIQP